MYLKPTQTLWAKIEEKIQSMFKDRLAYAHDWTHYGLKKSEINQLIIANLFTPEEDAMIQALGAKWFQTSTDTHVEIPNGQSTVTYTVDVNVGRKGFVSPHWASYHVSTRPKVTDETVIAIATKRREAIAKINAEQDAFKAQVKSIWENAPSVNALAKIWPPIVDLLPPDVVQQLEKKTTRRTSKQMADEIDTKSLSVSILKAKVGQ